MTKYAEVTLCSECYDRHQCKQIVAIVARSNCADCGCLCLGYVTVKPE
jgi:hypothetical protein